MFNLRFLLSLAASLAFSTFVSAAEEPTLAQRLDKLTETLEDARRGAHVPGMSIAIVKDDEVVFARGFGFADVATEKAADEHTIYAIGSTTKAFTATLVGMLVDEGKANWDDPVTEYLPYFDLQVRSDDDDAECTLRDLLSHRHGFARMSILWFGGNVSRDEVLRTASGAEPFDDFREHFHYCNVTYLAAGEAAGVAGSSTWDSLMAKRIFEPLGMQASTLTRAEAQQDPHLALGYKWDEVEERFEHEPMVSLENIGPAGSVNSSVTDMAQWLRLQLGKGQIDGKQLVSTMGILETWSPQIDIQEDVSYGLGWMLREHDGRHIVEHGGNIDGFSAQIGLMPEESLGYVLLMNRSVSPLQQKSIRIVFNALLDEWPDEKAPIASSEIDFADYVGTYIANFAKFRDEEFEILIENDKLALDIPSQRTFELGEPDTEGKWSFALTDTISVSFGRDSDGAVVDLTVHQGGFNFRVPRKGLEVASDATGDDLEKFVGTYVRVQGGKRIKISLERGSLTITDKGNLLSFETPDEEGHASLRARADHGATFHADAEGHVESLTFHGASGDRLFKRLNEELDTEVPTLEEVLALRNKDGRISAWRDARGTKITGKVFAAQAGVHGSVEIYTKGKGSYANHVDFGKFGRISTVARAGEAWSCNPMRGLDALNGDELAQAILGHPGAIAGDWNEYFDSVEVVRNDTWDDRPVHVVRLRKGDLPSRTYWIDAEHGNVLRVKQIMIENTVKIPVTIALSEFEEFDGIRFAGRMEIENPASGRTIFTIDRFETGLDLDEHVFTLVDPDEEAKQSKN